MKQAALQQAGKQLGMPVKMIAELTGVSTRTIWNSTTGAQYSGRKAWQQRSYKECSDAIEEMERRAKNAGLVW